MQNLRFKENERLITGMIRLALSNEKELENRRILVEEELI